jgi:hypothetical protein
MDSIFAILKAAAKPSQDTAAAEAAAATSILTSPGSLFGNLTSGEKSKIAGQMGTTAEAANAAAAQAMDAARYVNPNSSAIAFVFHAANGTFAAAVAETRGAACVADGIVNFIDREATDYANNNSLSSQQISNTLYAGGGLSWASPSVDTFKSQVATMKSTADFMTSTANAMASWVTSGKPDDGNYSRWFDGKSAEDIAKTVAHFAALGVAESLQASQLTTAFANHAVTFEKAMDVKGLDYSETYSGYGLGGGMGGSASVSENQDFVTHNADGKQHTTMNFGGVAMFMTY